MSTPDDDYAVCDKLLQWLDGEAECAVGQMRAQCLSEAAALRAILADARRAKELEQALREALPQCRSLRMRQRLHAALAAPAPSGGTKGEP